MYVYKITNLLNNKIYIGITNNYKKRWANHKCCKTSLIGKAIQKYKIENFKFEILFSNLSIEEASNKEIELIQYYDCLAPKGYNISKGGYHISNNSMMGVSNGNSKLTYEEVFYLKSHRNQPMYVLYELYNEKISYDAFKKIYHNQTYQDIKPTVDEYPYNLEYSNQFTSNNKLDYGDIIYLRDLYKKGVYWREAFKEYKNIFKDEWSFWNIYNGNKYKLVEPEIFTKENKNKHSQLSPHKGENNGRAKLTKEDILKIRKLSNSGFSNSEIYKLYPQVSSTSIRNIINYKTWKNI